jgi:hypothetical protein
MSNAESGNANLENAGGHVGSVEKDNNGQPLIPNLGQNPGFGMGFGFDATGGFPNMGMMAQGGDFNQMHMMMAMQNGMAPNSFGNFPMMGTL